MPGHFPLQLVVLASCSTEGGVDTVLTTYYLLRVLVHFGTNTHSQLRWRRCFQISEDYAADLAALVYLLRHEYGHWAWNMLGGVDEPHALTQIHPVTVEVINLTGAEFSCVPVLPL